MAKAVDQGTVDQMISLLRQPDWNRWSEGIFDDNTLIEGLTAVYTQAIDGDDEQLRAMAIWAMGETALTEFVPKIIEDLELDPFIACYALGKIPSEDGIHALIGMLDHEDMFVRDSAVWGLGSAPYTDSMEEAREDALNALKDRLHEEKEDWIVVNIQAAITLIETGVATTPGLSRSTQ
jgi:HEAT repeat protein